MNKVDFKKKIIIGTANFTQKYGADLTKVNLNEIKTILEIAKKNKIYNFDTAESYLQSKKVFKKIDKKFQFFSKIKPSLKWVSLEFCQKKIEDHLKIIDRKNFKTILFHDTKILFSKNGKKIYKNLEELKKRKYFKKIGISIYDMNNLNFLTTNYNLDVVQCPYNILDKRILKTGWFDKLKYMSIETHVRSIFLQGLLVNKLVYKKKYFKKWKKFFFDWFKDLENNNISPIDYCLSDLLKNNFDKIVIGINNSQNLNEILNFKNINKSNMIKLNINDTKLIDPRNWK
jgi:aryl-alcohol dehydrogenase-like predicted oxidoreductase